MDAFHDFENTALLNFVLHSVTSTSASTVGRSVEGKIIYDTTGHKPYYYDGTSWVSMA